MKKKCLPLFNIKIPLYVGLGSKQHNYQQLPRNLSGSTLLFEISGNFFHRANVQIRLTNSPFPVRFRSLFKGPLAPLRRTYFLNTPKPKLFHDILHYLISDGATKLSDGAIKFRCAVRDQILFITITCLFSLAYFMYFMYYLL